MRIVVQRVSSASVMINNNLHSGIERGFLVLLGIAHGDGDEDVSYLASKLCSLRVFADGEGRMNLDIRQVNGELLVVSQFTLHASTRKGNRPSFIAAAPPEIAVPLYERFVARCETLLGKPCKTGVFGGDMKIALVNDGPVTIVIDSKMKE